MFDFLKRIFNPAVFEIRIKSGKADLTRGKATKAFVKECQEICIQEHLDGITVYGKNSEYGIRLDFSGNTPEACRQKFRNMWEIHK